MQQRFDSNDRERVLFFLQRDFESRLRPVGGRQKYLEAADGTRFVIFGGHGYWHGIDNFILNDLAEYENEVVMVVSLVSKTRMRIYTGPMDKFLSFALGETRTSNDQVTFNIRCRGESVQIVEAPDIWLSLAAEFPHNEADRARAERQKRIRRQIANLSDDEKAELIERLGQSDPA